MNDDEISVDIAVEEAEIPVDISSDVLKGEQGPKGDKGDTGSQGVQGEKGDTGMKGDKR